jgi:hypothetical protein
MELILDLWIDVINYQMMQLQNLGKTPYKFSKTNMGRKNFSKLRNFATFSTVQRVMCEQ